MDAVPLLNFNDYTLASNEDAPLYLSSPGPSDVRTRSTNFDRRSSWVYRNRTTVLSSRSNSNSFNSPDARARADQLLENKHHLSWNCSATQCSLFCSVIDIPSHSTV